MVRILKLLVVIALAAVLVVGLTTTACCDGTTPNNPNGNTNGNEPNGNEPNGDEPNGNEPNGLDLGEPENDEPEPVFTGLGSIIDCDEYTGQSLQIGDPAPDFRFRAKQTFSLSDFRGKLVMLNFWAEWCNLCHTEIKYIQQTYDDWEEKGVLVLTIDLDESSDIAILTAFIKAKEISFPVIMDRGREVAAQYRVVGLPRTFFIDEEGIIQAIKIGAFSSMEDIENILNQLIAD